MHPGEIGRGDKMDLFPESRGKDTCVAYTSVLPPWHLCSISQLPKFKVISLRFSASNFVALEAKKPNTKWPSTKPYSSLCILHNIMQKLIWILLQIWKKNRRDTSQLEAECGISVTMILKLDIASK